MVAVRLDSITKRFGAVTAVDNVSLEVPEGELFFLLGPSGCGKTTLLRTIAGFETPDAGAVLFDSRDITALAPHKRNTGMVFQNYALWPHMTVFDNVAYGLRVRSAEKSQLKIRVRDALRMVRMEPQTDRFPNQLSGGQQQRVALARSLVINPDCLLLDEPLSNLDAKLRLEMRDEIRRIHRETGVTTIYVTHDQKEALSMAECLAVLSDGRVVQTGAPEDVYARPADAFVAAFIGDTNLIPCNIIEAHGCEAAIACPWGRLRGTLCGFDNPVPGAPCLASIRPENVEVAPSADAANSFPAEIIHRTFLGDVGQYVFRVDSVEIKALVLAPRAAAREGRVDLVLPPDHLLVFPAPAGGGSDAV